MPKMRKGLTEEERRVIRNEQRKSNYERGAVFSVRQREPWTEMEIAEVEAHSVPDSELARRILRSVQAIQVKRWRIRNNPA